MIRAQHALEANIFVRLDTGQHISPAIIVECFVEFLWRSFYISKMDKENLVLFAEVADYTGQVIGHHGEIALAETDAIDRAGN